MKTKLSGLILGSTLLLVSVVVSRAEPNPDLMNSISNTRLEAAKTSKASAIKSSAKHDFAKGSPWSHTRNITAGQSTVAVPDFARTTK